MATNLVVSGIQTATVSYLNGLQTYIAVSTNATPPAMSDINLGGTELREAVYSSSTTSNSVTKEMYLDLTQFNGNTINKAGLYSASTGDNLLGAALTNALTKNASTEIFVSITTTVNVVSP